MVKGNKVVVKVRYIEHTDGNKGTNKQASTWILGFKSVDKFSPLSYMFCVIKGALKSFIF